MHGSDRILTSHVGSLPRPPEVIELLRRHTRGEPYDAAELARIVALAVPQIVAQQVDAGIDIVSDGEVSKASYGTYIQERLSGFSEVDAGVIPADRHLEHEAFPEYYDKTRSGRGPRARRRLACTGPIAMRDREPLKQDLANLRRAVSESKPTAAFMPSASPGVIARFHPNFHYDSARSYREAIAKAMREEYEAIVEAGFLLQVDCPDLASGRQTVFAHLTEAEFIGECEISLAVLDEALVNVPGDRVRLHLCWGNYEGPHIHDIAIERILPIVLRSKPDIISFEGANPRHAHEWQVWQRIKLPEKKMIMPGVIDSTTNFVEHPELVAQRIVQYANLVGRERVIASVDCGFETFVGDSAVHPSIVYRKLESLAEGARIASRLLWSMNSTPHAG